MIQNLKSVITLEYQNNKNIFAKGYTPDWSEEEFRIKKKLEIQFHGHMLLMILMVKKLLEHFMKMSCKRQTKKNSE